MSLDGRFKISALHVLYYDESLVEDLYSWKMKRYISWNVNGLRAVINKGFWDIFSEINSDAFCLQEIKLKEGQIDAEVPGYFSYWNYAEKKGYSGTAIFTKIKPISVSMDLPDEMHNHEGRCICLEYSDHFLVTVYTPNSQEELKRLAYRMEWEDAFRKYLILLDKIKPVIICGDMNVAHEPIDLKNDKTNHKSAGFTDAERAKMSKLLASGFTDTYRFLYPEKEEYSWWSYRMKARERNAGWRIDYFLISDRLNEKLRDAFIYTDIKGSDHAPVGICIDI